MRHWQLFVAAIWISLGFSLIFRESLGIRFANYGEKQMALIIFVAFAMAAWNVVRWWFQQGRRTTGELPMTPRLDPPKYEYNPELDFQKMERDQPGQGG
jgi:hypothetical protein